MSILILMKQVYPSQLNMFREKYISNYLVVEIELSNFEAKVMDR
jgi:hypothetical protein